MKDKDTKLIARRYARALFTLAKEKNALEQVDKDMHALYTLIQESAEFNALLHTPILSRKSKEIIIKQSLAGSLFHPLMMQFLAQLARSRRLPMLYDIAEALAAMIREYNNIIEVKAITATTLSDTHKTKIKELMHNATQKHIALETELDTSLLGGIRLEMGNTLIDASLRGKLNRLRLTLKGARA